MNLRIAHRGWLVLLSFTMAAAVPLIGQDRSDRAKRIEELANAEREFAAFTVKEGFRDGFIKYFAEDGIGFGPQPQQTRAVLQKTPPATGPRRVIFNWAPMLGDISAAGDLGYTTGPVLYTDVTDNPRPPRHGMYFSVWQKQADGSWKVVVDMGVDLPRAVAPIDTPFTPVPAVTGRSTTKKADDFTKLDELFTSSIMRTSPAKAYSSIVDAHFRIHRKGMMPITDRSELKAPAVTQTKFEFIGGRAASSDDMAFTYGKYTTVSEPVESSGYYVHVWRRDASGRWRLVADVTNPLEKK